MTEPHGVSAALGIEAVEWSACVDESLTVRVTGRWRRRRPGPSSQPLLVIETADRRHRFPAMPEPPGLTGAAPGTWQLSFAVPATLRPPAFERAWLQMGSVVVPLPMVVQADVDPDSNGGARPELARGRLEDFADPRLLAERRLRTSELALQATRLRAGQAEQTVADLATRAEGLERELELARREPARLQALLLQRDAACRAADQRAHAEGARCAELQEELTQLEAGRGDTGAVLDELRRAGRRVAELEGDIERLSRRADEAEQSAAVGRVARERAQAALEERAAAGGDSFPQAPGLASVISAEERLWFRITTDPPPPTLSRPTHGPGTPALAAERRHPRPQPRTEADGGSSQRQEVLDPARLDAALARLRESAAVHERVPSTAEARASGPWLAGAFASLAERDRVAAGRILLALLPAQDLVSAEPLAYDLLLTGLGCVQVSVGDSSPSTVVRHSETPRPAGEVGFALSGDLGSLAALVARGSLRRRFGRPRVRLTGDRRAADALLALVHEAVCLDALIRAGVRMDPWLALTLASQMIDPAWTLGERFSVAFREPSSVTPGAYLHVRDGHSPMVSSGDLPEAPESTVVCAGERVLSVLDGDLRAGAQLRGDTRPLGLLQRWIERAQSG